MLTGAAPLVKLVPGTTPEQQSCARDVDQALTLFWTLVERLQDAADDQKPIHHVEEMIFRDVLKIGHALLRLELLDERIEDFEVAAYTTEGLYRDG